MKAEITNLKEGKRLKDEKLAQDKKDEEERKEKEQRIYNFRCQDLIELGMKAGNKGYGMTNKFNHYVSITFDEIKTETDWKSKIETVTPLKL